MCVSGVLDKGDRAAVSGFKLLLQCWVRALGRTEPVTMLRTPGPSALGAWGPGGEFLPRRGALAVVPVSGWWAGGDGARQRGGSSASRRIAPHCRSEEVSCAVFPSTSN